MTFKKYDSDELRRCGEEFKADFEDDGLSGTRDWTEKVCSWFAGTKTSADIRPFYHPETAEFIFDLCHTTYPMILPNERLCDRWRRALDEGRCQLRLALECEWGKNGDQDESLSMILDDAWKLAVSRADIKVMVFASQQRKDREKIVFRLIQLRRHNGDRAPWLLIDVPWSNGELPRDIYCTVLEESETRA
jgi:hypothetical protein